MNNTFSTTLAVLHVEVSFYQLMLLGDFLTGTAIRRAWLASLVFHVVMLWDLASNSSQIIDLCSETAFGFLSFTPKVTSYSELASWAQSAKIMSYDQSRDSLMILDCFTLSKNSFFSYVSTMVACTAVFLQFDYRILAKLATDKKVEG